MEAVDLRWRKSSFSGNGGDCVEVGQLGDGVIVVRDTKDRSGTVHSYAPLRGARSSLGCAAANSL